MKLDKIPTAASAISTTVDSDSRWHGALDGTYKNMLYGWAVDTQQVNARVVLEVCLNEEAIGSVTADVARTDLTELFAALPRPPDDPCHGFVADLGSLVEDITGTLTVRVANTGVLLEGAIATRKDFAAPVAAISNVFSDGGLKLHGWARDALDDKRTMRVRAFLDSEQIAEVLANDDHPALRSHEVGRHGFTLDLPLSLADGQSHSVRILTDEGIALNGSPVTVCCHADGLASLLPNADSLLADVADIYERYVPRTVGMRHYRSWSQRFDTAGPPAHLGKAKQRVGIIVCGDADAPALSRTQASIERQSCAGVTAYLPTNKRGKVVSFESQVHSALSAGCDVIGCVRAGDELLPHALAYALQGFNTPSAALVYTDSEQDDIPWFKPAWNADYALGSDYPLELMLVKRAVVEKLMQSPAAPSNQAGFSWQLLAALWPQANEAIIHVPRVLYRFHTSLSEVEKTARAAAASLALQHAEPDAALIPITAVHSAAEFLPRRVVRNLSKRERAKAVTLIIPTRDHVELLERCITSLNKFTNWPALEIIVVDNGSVLGKTKTYLKKLARAGVQILHAPGQFNFAALNNAAVARATGEIVALINNDIEALHEGWLDEMVAQLMRPCVGAVGAKLLWPNGMVQHGGVVLGLSNVAGHFGNRLATSDWGDHGRNRMVQQVSAVTAACLLMRKQDYLAVGGMDEVKFPVAFNDVDLCLKLRSTGKTITWTPFAAMLHAESASRGHEDTPQKRARANREVENLRRAWGSVLLRDPAYHPSLNLDAHSHAFGGLALPPRDRRPRNGDLMSPQPDVAELDVTQGKKSVTTTRTKKS